MLLEKVREGLVGELLEVLHTVLGEPIESVPSFVVELNALTGHSHLRRDMLALHDRPGEFR